MSDAENLPLAQRDQLLAVRNMLINVLNTVDRQLGIVRETYKPQLISILPPETLQGRSLIFDPNNGEIIEKKMEKISSSLVFPRYRRRYFMNYYYIRTKWFISMIWSIVSFLTNIDIPPMNWEEKPE